MKQYFYVANNPKMAACDHVHCYRKIGKIFKESPEARLRGLNREITHETFYFILLIEVSNCHAVENYFKELFTAKYSGEGEFYWLDDSDLNTIINYCLSIGGKIEYAGDFQTPSIKYNTKKDQDEYFKKIFPRSNPNNLNGISRPSKDNKSYVLNGRNIGAFAEEINGNLVIKKGSKFRPEPLPDYLNRCGEDEGNFCEDIYKNKIRKTRSGEAVLKEDLPVRDINQAARVVTGSRRYNCPFIEIR